MKDVENPGAQVDDQKPGETSTAGSGSPPQRMKSSVRLRAQGAAAVLGGLLGILVAIVIMWTPDEEAGPSEGAAKPSWNPQEAWTFLSDSAVGAALLCVVVATAAVVSRFIVDVPSLDDWFASGDKRYVESWKSFSIEVHAWREFVGVIIPTGVAGAAYGYAVAALATTAVEQKEIFVVLAIMAAVVPILLAVWYLPSRSRELVSFLEGSKS